MENANNSASAAMFGALQCGHGYDAVENWSAGRLAGALKDLQCGHGYDAVENMTRFQHSHDRLLTFNAATAMTPWRTIGTPAWPPVGFVLQCGHGYDAVENQWRQSQTPYTSRALQCGHGYDAVENSAGANTITVA